METREVVEGLAEEYGVTLREMGEALDEGRVGIDRKGRLTVLPPEVRGPSLDFDVEGDAA